MTQALDEKLAALIEPRTGPILEAARSARGHTSDYTGVITHGTGRVFLKAVRDGGPFVSSLEREAAVNPAVREFSPALLWQARGCGWLALAFEHAAGTRHASFKPGSPDLPGVTALIDRIGRAPLPDAARDWTETRYDRYAGNGTAALLAGPALLHGDINPDNFLIRPDGGVIIVDWAWPTRGAGLIDPGCLAVQLIAAGHTPAGAEEWVARCAAWHEADRAAADAFAAAIARMYQRFREIDPAPWRKTMTEAAAAWLRHRTGQR